MTDDLWESASEDHALTARQASLAYAEAQMGDVMPFVLAARSEDELEHRLAYAADPIAAIASSTGVDEADLADGARRQWGLYRQALAEGTDPMTALEPELGGGQYGQGPEKPDEHDQGPDLGHGYSEVPPGPPGGPDPRTTAPRPPRQQQVQEATGMRRRADADPGSMMTPSYPGSAGGSALPSSSPAPLPAGVGSGSPDNTTPLTPPQDGNVADEPNTVTASSDPVRRKVLAVTAAVRATNPQLPGREAERVARQIVGRYFTADLAGSVENDDPVNSGGGGGGGGGQGGGGGNMVEHGLEWQGLKGLMGGGGEVAELGAAAV